MVFPLLWLVGKAALGDLGANPIEALIRALGDWALGILLLSLAISPIRQWFGWLAIMRLRRMIGLWAFAYAVFHVMGYVVLDQYFDWIAIAQDIIKRTYITLGMASLVILFVLALTSIPRVISIIGGVRWKILHKSVYIAGILGVMHYFWMVKADLSAPSVYAVCLGVLLIVRLLPKRDSRLALKS